MSTVCKPVTSAFLILTNRCNLACRYCFVEQNPREMSLQVAKDAVNFLLKNARETNRLPQITFFGGEPTLRWDDIIVPLVDYVENTLQEQVIFSITSNCILLNEDRLQWLKDHGIGLLFSIDGDKPTQDYNRCFHNGAGSFDRLKDLIPLIPKYFPNTTFRSTVIPQTSQYLFDNIMFAKDSGFHNVYVIPNVYEEWNLEARKNLESGLRAFCEYYIHCFENGREPIHLSPFERAFGKLWRIQNISNRREEFAHVCAYGKCGFCASGGCAIGPDGLIYGCQEIQSSKGVEDIFCVGSIYTGIDEDRRDALIRAFNIQKAHGQDCANCVMDKICDGGCVANNYLINGDLNAVPKMYCYWNCLLIEEANRVAKILGERKNERFRDTFVQFVRGGGYGL